MRVLQLIPYMHPTAGGPPVVVDRWAVELQKLGWDVDVLTTDAYAQGDDGWEEPFRQRYPMTVVRHAGPNGFGYGRELRRQLKRLVRGCDLVHVHNLWSYSNRLAAAECPRAGVPFVVSSHGMLDPNSVSRKLWKKRIYGSLFEWRQLRRAAAMVFTHAEEERLARSTCSGLPAGHVVPLGTEEPPAANRATLAGTFLAKHPKLADGPRIVFLGRLHAKKGLDLLLPAFRQVLDRIPAARLLLVGPGEAGYVRQLQGTAEALQIGERTTFVGSLAGEDKWSALAAGDVFALPSYQENFAIALVEALRVGTPAVCSRRVNIWQDLVSAGAAEDCELTVESVAERLLDLLQNDARRGEMGLQAEAFAAANYTWPHSAASLQAAYRRVLTPDRAVQPSAADRQV